MQAKSSQKHSKTNAKFTVKTIEHSIEKGTIHLYKESYDEATDLFLHQNDATLLALLAVPSYLSPMDLLHFLGSFQETIDYIRLVKDSMPNRYLVILKMKDVTSASDFIKEFNGIRFNSLEPEVCHVVYVDSIEFHSEENCMRASNDSKLLLELPTCPVCLERLDTSVTGLLTIICSHTFHCHCIAKWGDGSCPVCRYSLVHAKDDASMCHVCHTQSDLWICLICGHLGCGRYKSGHASQHFLETSHCYALEIETQRVWDYAGDAYVHRLLRNKEDGKLVELSLPTSSHVTDSKQNEASHGDFAELLATQLESQRIYFESFVKKVEATHHSELGYLMDKVDSLSLFQQTNQEKQQAMSIEIESLTREKKSLEKKLEKVTKRGDILQKLFDEEKAVNVSLLADQNFFKEKLASKDNLLKQKQEEIDDLKEQVRDLMFYLNTLEKSQANPEISGASIVHSSSHTNKS